MAILDGRDLSTCRRFAGYLADRSICTSQVELDEAHRRLWIRLASVTRFSVALDRAGTDQLIDTLAGGGTCAVRCEHEAGPRLLRVHPEPEPAIIPHSERRPDPWSGPPMRLRLGDDPDDRIAVTLTRKATDALLAHLHACRGAMSTIDEDQATPEPRRPD